MADLAFTVDTSQAVQALKNFETVIKKTGERSDKAVEEVEKLSQAIGGIKISRANLNALDRFSDQLQSLEFGRVAHDITRFSAAMERASSATTHLKNISDAARTAAASAARAAPKFDALSAAIAQMKIPAATVRSIERFAQSVTSINISSTVSQLRRLEATLRSLGEVSAHTSTAMARSFRLSDAGGELDRTRSRVTALAAAFSSLKTVIAGTAVVYGIRKLAGLVSDTVMSLQRMANTLTSVVGSRDVNAYFRQIVDTTMGLGQNLPTATQGFAKLAAAAQGTSLTMRDVKKIFDAVITTGTALSMDVVDLDAVFRVFIQILSKGKVSAEELRQQLGERLPGAFSLAAKSLGVTQRELSNMLDKGMLYSEEFVPKFADTLLKTYKEGAEIASREIPALWARIKNAWNLAVDELRRSGGFEIVRKMLEETVQLLGEPRFKQLLMDFIRSFTVMMIELWKALNAVLPALLSVLEHGFKAIAQVFELLTPVAKVVNDVILYLTDSAISLGGELDRLVAKPVIKFFSDIASAVKEADESIKRYGQSVNELHTPVGIGDTIALGITGSMDLTGKERDYITQQQREAESRRLQNLKIQYDETRERLDYLRQTHEKLAEEAAKSGSVMDRFGLILNTLAIKQTEEQLKTLEDRLRTLTGAFDSASVGAEGLQAQFKKLQESNQNIDFSLSERALGGEMVSTPTLTKLEAEYNAMKNEADQRYKQYMKDLEDELRNKVELYIFMKRESMFQSAALEKEYVSNEISSIFNKMELDYAEAEKILNRIIEKSKVAGASRIDFSLFFKTVEETNKKSLEALREHERALEQNQKALEKYGEAYETTVERMSKSAYNLALALKERLQLVPNQDLDELREIFNREAKGLLVQYKIPRELVESLGDLGALIKDRTIDAEALRDKLVEIFQGLYASPEIIDQLKQMGEGFKDLKETAAKEWLEVGKVIDDTRAKIEALYQSYGVSPETARAYDKIAEAEQKVYDKAREYVEKNNDKIRKEYESLGKDIHETLSDAFYDVFKNIDNGWKALLDSLKNWFLKFAAYIISQPIAVQITPIVAGILGISVPAGATPQTASFGKYSINWSKIPGMGWLSNPVPWASSQPVMVPAEPGTAVPASGTPLTWGTSLLYGAGALAAGYGAYNSFSKGGLGGWLGGGLQAAGSLALLAKALGIGAGVSWLGPAGIALAIGGSLLGSILGGGKKKDDTDLFFGLGSSLTYSELTTALDKVTRGIVSVNVRKGAYMSSEQASQLEKQIADYYANWLNGLDASLAESVLKTLTEQPVELHINNLQKILESGGIDAVFAAINEELFKTLGELFKKSFTDVVGTKYQDALAVMGTDVVEGWMQSIQGAETFEEYSKAAETISQTLERVSQALKSFDAVVAGSDLARYQNAIDAINEKYDAARAELESLGVEIDKTNLELARQVELQRQYSAVLQEAYGALAGLAGLSAEQSWNFYSKSLGAKYGATITPELVQSVIDALANANEDYILEVTKWLDTLGISFSEFVGDVNGAANALNNLKNSAKAYADAVANYGQIIYHATGDPNAALSAYKQKYNIPNWTAQDVITIVDQYIKGGPKKQEELALTYAKHMGVDLSNVTAEDWQAYNQFLQETLSLYEMLTSNTKNASDSVKDFSDTLKDSTRDAANAAENLIRSLKQVEDAYKDFVYDLRFGDLAPVKSLEQYQQEYAKLYANASKSPEDYQAFLNFAKDYLSAYGTIAGSDSGYLAVYNSILDAAEKLKIDTEKNLTVQAMREVATLLGTSGPLYAVLSQIYNAIVSGKDISIYLDGKLVGAAVSQQQSQTTQSTAAATGGTSSGSGMIVASSSGAVFGSAQGPLPIPSTPPMTWEQIVAKAKNFFK